MLALAGMQTTMGRAGTYVFPQTSETQVTYCDGALGHPPENVSNSSGCGTSADFQGGEFVLRNGITQYANAPNEAVGCGAQMSVTFRQFATDFSLTVVNSIVPQDTNQYSLQMRYSVGNDPDTGAPIVSTTQYPLIAGQSLSLSGSGYAIDQVLLTTMCPTCIGFQGAPIAITSFSATQPILPDVTLSVNRNGDGSYTAVVQYSIPTGTSTLTLQSLPTGQEPSVNYLTRTGLSGSGTITQNLGTFDTDRTIEAILTGCEGNRQRYASVSGCPDCQNPRKSVGGPVRLYDGVMTYSETDPLPSTIGPEFRRAYSSGAAANGRFGLGWSSIFDASALSVSADNKIVAVVNEDRTRAIFELATTGRWVQKWPVGGNTATLTGSEASGYTFREASGAFVRTFGANHHLTRVQDVRRGRAVSITYDASGNPTSIADEAGTWSCTITTASNHVTNIAVDGRPDLSWTYAYTGSLLTSVSVAGAPSAWRTYQYTGNRLSAILDATAAVIERHDYDVAGRATSSFDASGDLTNIQYPASDVNGIATTTVTRADNSIATYEQAFSAGAVVTRHADGGCSSCGAQDATAAYDTFGNLIRLQNARGYVTESTYDSVGHRLTKTVTALTPSGCDPATDPGHCRLSSDALSTAILVQTSASQTTQYTYGDPNWLSRPTLITRDSVLVSGGLSQESFTLDPVTGETLVHTMRGYVDTSGTQEAHTTTTTLYASGDTPAFNPGGAFQPSWLTLPQPTGLKKSVDGPRTDVSDVTKFVYYPFDTTVPGPWRGQLAAIQNALGHITHYQDYDVFGHPGTVIDANGVNTRFTYDSLGRLLTSTVAGVPGCNTTVDPLCATDVTTTQTYSSTTGPLISVQRPAGNVTTYAYDTRGRLQILSRGTASTPLEKIDYTYDPTSGKKASEVISAY